jgi:hypothetical protein
MVSATYSSKTSKQLHCSIKTTYGIVYNYAVAQNLSVIGTYLIVGAGELIPRLLEPVIDPRTQLT